MSYSDDLFDSSPAPQREGFTNFDTDGTPNYQHWQVTQTGLGGTTNWFTTYADAADFQVRHGGTITGATCDDFEEGWPADWRKAHTHGASSDGERRRATEPDTARSDARRSQELGRLV